MLRNLHLGLLILVVVAGATFASFYHRTDVHEPTTEFILPNQDRVSLRIEYATTIEARERGLGGREILLADYGMLFVFPKDDRYGFWMKDMLVPIDIFWLNNKGQVVYIASDVATSTYPDVLYPDVPARYVLETAAGFGRAHRITFGTQLVLKNVVNVSK